MTVDHNTPTRETPHCETCGDEGVVCYGVGETSEEWAACPECRADNLPRPATPGQWVPVEEMVLVHPFHPRPTQQRLTLLTIDESYDADRDASAIAALPERIRRMDAVRDYAQTAVDIGRAIGNSAMERVGADVLALLDGEGGV